MKYIYAVILFVIMMGLGSLAFNHINAWLGIAIIVITILFVIKKSIDAAQKFTNKTKQ